MTQEEAHIKNLTHELYEFCRERDIPMLIMVELPGHIHQVITLPGPGNPRTNERVCDDLFAMIHLAYMLKKASDRQLHLL